MARYSVVTPSPFELTIPEQVGDARIAYLREPGSVAGIENIRITCSGSVPEDPSISLRLRIPLVDVQGYWHPRSFQQKSLQSGGRTVAQATSGAPVGCLFTRSDRNQLTFALSDALNPVTISAHVHEESASFDVHITLLDPPMSETTSYSVTLRVDTRDVSYQTAIEDVSAWWAQQPGYLPAPVPDVALQPMYSTWYSYHQHVSPQAIEAEAKLAKELGCVAVIVDDGWQTADNQRGYAYCGDWRPAPEKIPDMKAHVARVHALGLKYVLWYAVPFVGKESDAWESFKDKLLRYDEGLRAGVLDPRFPEVREFLIDTYERAVRDWDLDGVKLDFVDMFGRGAQPAAAGDGRDHASVAVASDRLLSDVIDRLRQLRPDILVEFRQTYTGPLMRKYGNMFRAVDCPGDAAQNRARIVDIRLLSGNTAAHADMIMWHPTESAEQAAIHIQNALFGVPQLSVRIAELTPEQREMTAFWLQFWKTHRDALMQGTLTAEGPHELYPLVTGTTADKQVTVVYAERAVHIEHWRDHVWIVNATANNRILLDARTQPSTLHIETSDCRGTVIAADVRVIAHGVHAIDVPRSGFVHLRRMG